MDRQEMEFTKAESKFLSKQEVCRVATCSDNVPHVTPVSYVFDPRESCIYFAIDYDSKKFRNLETNKNVCLTIDVYEPSEDNAAVIIRGRAELIERGKQFQRLYDQFFKRFAWVKENPWKQGEAPFVKVIPMHKVSWGI